MDVRGFLRKLLFLSQTFLLFLFHAFLFPYITAVAFQKLCGVISYFFFTPMPVSNGELEWVQSEKLRIKIVTWLDMARFRESDKYRPFVLVLFMVMKSLFDNMCIFYSQVIQNYTRFFFPYRPTDSVKTVFVFRLLHVVIFIHNFFTKNLWIHYFFFRCLNSYRNRFSWKWWRRICFVSVSFA